MYQNVILNKAKHQILLKNSETQIRTLAIKIKDITTLLQDFNKKKGAEAPHFYLNN